MFTCTKHIVLAAFCCSALIHADELSDRLQGAFFPTVTQIPVWHDEATGWHEIRIVSTDDTDTVRYLDYDKDGCSSEYCGQGRCERVNNPVAHYYHYTYSDNCGNKLAFDIAATPSGIHGDFATIFPSRIQTRNATPCCLADSKNAS